MANPFKHVDSVSYSKEETMRDSDGELIPDSGYVAYLTNKGLSYHADSILHVNEVNMRANLSDDAQYRYYKESLRPRKRFGKWKKAKDLEDVELIQKYYGVSPIIARQYLKTLATEDVERIRGYYAGG